MPQKSNQGYHYLPGHSLSKEMPLFIGEKMDRPCWTLNHGIVGRVYPQHQKWKKQADQPDYSVGIFDEQRLQTWSGPLPTAVIAKGAKLSDLISSAAMNSHGLFLSSRMRIVLEQFSLTEHHFIQTPMEHKGQAVEGYWFFHVSTPVFPITEESTPREVEESIETNPAISLVDLLRIKYPIRYAYWFVSNRLKKAIEDAGLTGIRFGTAKIFR